MSNETTIDELPENFEELKKSANRTANWRERLAAIEELGEWDHPKVISILQWSASEDPAPAVQEAARKALKKLGESPPGASKQKGDLVKGLMKTLVRIKKILPEDHTVQDFREKLKKTRSDIYDIYEGAKGEEFDQWLADTWASLRTKRD